MNFKLVLQYDGTDFAGWQRQPKLRTIQGELEEALSKLFAEKIRVIAAGRTDAGVHAIGQVANFVGSKDRNLSAIQSGLNSLLPDSISVSSVQNIKADFNARFDAVRRHYLYQIVRLKNALLSRYSWCVQGELNLPEMQLCCRAIIGEHDFRSFCSAQAEVNHYRCSVLEASWQYMEFGILAFSISANRFLHNMVRILVGTMVEVGTGRFTYTDFLEMLKNKDRRCAGITAPSRGLCLSRVDYDQAHLEEA